MAKVVFPYHVLYGGLLRPPLKPFDVPDAEASKLAQQGAKVAYTASQAKPRASNTSNAKATQKKR